MEQITSDILFYIFAAAVIGFILGWIIRIWPFHVRFKEVEKSIESYSKEYDEKLNRIESDITNAVKSLQINYEERMMNFKTGYEEWTNNFANDYADGFSSIRNEYNDFKEEILQFKKEVELKLSEYSSKSYYLENKLKSEVSDKEYEVKIEKLKERTEKLAKRISTHKHVGASKTNTKTEVKKKTRPAAKISKDDLQKITGIGKVLETNLYRQRVYTYEQIAELTKEAIDKIDKKITGIKERIKRDKWISQAKKLLRQKKKQMAV